MNDKFDEPLTIREEWPWRGLLKFHAVATREMSNELQLHIGLTLLEYDLLGHLHEQPDLCMVMNELAENVQITPSGITRMVDRLVARGLVERRPYSGDARRLLAVLTTAGAALYEKAQHRQNAEIRRRFLDRLTDEQRSVLATVWTQLSGAN